MEFMDSELLELFRKVLEMDSTSGQEAGLARYLYQELEAPQKELLEVGDGSLNLLLKWSDKPKVVYCTHLDTVPPYIPPRFEEDGSVWGRGSCDAKGQLISLLGACRALERMGRRDFALLLLSGEETGSFGAKAFSGYLGAPLLVIGEPTDNTPIKATKGTLSYSLQFSGKACHSGYPEYGDSAIERWVDFMMELEMENNWSRDKVLGETTWNVGMLSSMNAKNVLSPSLSCQLYFRSTFASHEKVKAWMEKKNSSTLSVTFMGGDPPREYYVPEGFKGKVAAFGSDAPHLHGFEKKIICGPGSILDAHTQDEKILLEDIEIAIKNNIVFYESCN